MTDVASGKRWIEAEIPRLWGDSVLVDWADLPRESATMLVLEIQGVKGTIRERFAFAQLEDLTNDAGDQAAGRARLARILQRGGHRG